MRSFEHTMYSIAGFFLKKETERVSERSSSRGGRGLGVWRRGPRPPGPRGGGSQLATASPGPRAPARGASGRAWSRGRRAAHEGLRPGGRRSRGPGRHAPGLRQRPSGRLGPRAALPRPPPWRSLAASSLLGRPLRGLGADMGRDFLCRGQLAPVPTRPRRRGGAAHVLTRPGGRKASERAVQALMHAAQLERQWVSD